MIKVLGDGMRWDHIEPQEVQMMQQQASPQQAAPSTLPPVSQSGVASEPKDPQQPAESNVHDRDQAVEVPATLIETPTEVVDIPDDPAPQPDFWPDNQLGLSQFAQDPLGLNKGTGDETPDVPMSPAPIVREAEAAAAAAPKHPAPVPAALVEEMSKVAISTPKATATPQQKQTIEGPIKFAPITPDAAQVWQTLLRRQSTDSIPASAADTPLESPWTPPDLKPQHLHQHQLRPHLQRRHPHVPHRLLHQLQHMQHRLHKQPVHLTLSSAFGSSSSTWTILSGWISSRWFRRWCWREACPTTMSRPLQAQLRPLQHHRPARHQVLHQHLLKPHLRLNLRPQQVQHLCSLWSQDQFQQWSSWRWMQNSWKQDLIRFKRPKLLKTLFKVASHPLWKTHSKHCFSLMPGCSSMAHQHLRLLRPHLRHLLQKMMLVMMGRPWRKRRLLEPPTCDTIAVCDLPRCQLQWQSNSVRRAKTILENWQLNCLQHTWNLVRTGCLLRSSWRNPKPTKRPKGGNGVGWPMKKLDYFP